MTVNQALGRTDWVLLAKQKQVLVEIAYYRTALNDEGNEAIDGIIHWIDAIQDAANAEGFPVVFLTGDDEREMPLAEGKYE